MKAISKVVFVVLLSIGMLWQGSLTAEGRGTNGRPALRKCCRAESVSVGNPCQTMSCCRTAAEVPVPASLPASSGTDSALLAQNLVLDYAPLSPRPPTVSRAEFTTPVPSVPLYQRLCIFLI